MTVAVLIDAGGVCDPAGREGTAHLTAKLLLEGTATSEGADLAQRFEQLGASIDAHADWDASAVTMTAMSEHLAAAFDLLGEVLRTPAFRQREVDRLKAERLAELLQLRAEPRGLADELFSRFLYSPASRYARPQDGDEASVDAIERDHVLAFYESRYLPGGTTVIVAGDVSADRAEELTRRALGDWRGRRAAARSLPTTARATRSRRTHHCQE